MSRIKMTMVALLAALSLSATAAGSASGNWFVNGSELKTSAALASLAIVHGSILLHFNQAGTLVLELCTGPIHFIGWLILPDGTVHGILLFLDCYTVTPTKCNLEGVGGATTAAIETVPVTGTAVLSSHSPEDRITFKPTSKTLFAELPFAASNTCALTEPVPIKGAVTLNAPRGQSEEVAQPLVPLGSVENNSLEVGSNKAFLEGDPGVILVLLASHSKWSFR